MRAGLRTEADRAAPARIQGDPGALEDVRHLADARLADAREAADRAASVTPVAARLARALAESGAHARGRHDATEQWATTADPLQ